MKDVARKSEAHFTYDDYRTWADETRRELINGEVFDQASPTWRHQSVVGNLFLAMGPFFTTGTCRLFMAPLDVVLSLDTVVQPDLLAVCRPDYLKGNCVEGAPDLAVEVLSPSSFLRDRLLKFKRYAEAGVKEYWIVTPEQAMIEVFVLADGTYRLQDGFVWKESLKSVLFPGLTFSLTSVFDAPEEGVAVVRESLSSPPSKHEDRR